MKKIPVISSTRKMDKTNKIVQVLQAGGAVLIATDTVYGLAALPSIPEAVEKIYLLKKRPKDMYLPVMVADIKDLEKLGLAINENARKLFASDLVPGAITFVLGFKNESLKPDWLKTRDEIATRIPDNALLLSVLRETGPLIDRADNLINLCEMKYSKSKYTITKSYDEILRNKRAAFIEETGTRKAIHLTMLTTYGLERNEYWGGVQSEITMDDLFMA